MWRPTITASKPEEAVGTRKSLQFGFRCFLIWQDVNIQGVNRGELRTSFDGVCFMTALH